MNNSSTQLIIDYSKYDESIRGEKKFIASLDHEKIVIAIVIIFLIIILASLCFTVIIVLSSKKPIKLRRAVPEDVVRL